jgi:hypothetical protein
MEKPIIDPVSSKTSEEALDFVRKMQKRFPKTPRTKKELAAVEKYLAKFTDAELKAVGRRVLSDLMQRPPRTIDPDDFPPAPIEKGMKPKAYPAGKRAAAARPRSARRRTKRS